jgi:hypothetical protein
MDVRGSRPFTQELTGAGFFGPQKHVLERGGNDA